MTGKTFYIVWNEARSEGFVTDDEDDARMAVARAFDMAYSAAGNAFAEVYDDEPLSLEEIVLPVRGE